MHLRGSKIDWVKYKSRATSINAWKLPRQPSSLAPSSVQSNKDQDPVLLELRTWGAWDFATYWMSDLINSTTWQIASAGMIVGLSTTDAIIIASLSGLLNSLPTVLCGSPGTHHHVPFPISIRAAYGYYLSTFCVVSRALLGSVWFGVNTYYGSFIVTEIIAAIWPSYRNIKNHIPTSTGITTQQMISYILFCLIQLPLLMIPVGRLKTLFMVKAFLLPLLSIAMVIWICVKAGSPSQVFSQPATVTGSTRVWLWLGTLSANSNAWLSSTINMPDFTRFARDKQAPLAMIPTIPIVRTIYAILGIAMTGAGRVLYQEDIWNPVLLLAKWTGPGGRFLAFVCGCLWLLAQLSTNVSANSAPFGHDAMSLAPSWINVRRGSVLCLLIGSWAMVPWMLVNTAAKFLTFMNGYGCFICAMVSISISDYYLVRRCKLDVPALYDPHGRYRYTAGANWRAAVVQLILMAICIPGLANTIDPTVQIPHGLIRLYDLNWFINTLGALVGYWTICKAFPIKDTLVPVTIDGVIPRASSDSEERQSDVITERGKAWLNRTVVCEQDGAKLAATKRSTNLKCA